MSDNAMTMIWAVYDADNFECGGIDSLYWSYEGALEGAKKLVADENATLARFAERNDEVEHYPKEMEQQGPDKWRWTHRTINVQRVEVRP